MSHKKKPFRVAAAQASPVFLNREETLKKACQLIREAGKHGAKLIVFPEVFISGYPDWVWVIPNCNATVLDELYTELLENSVTIPDETTTMLCRAARENKIYITIGIHERNVEASNSSLFNTLLFINDKGNIMGKHRKLIPTGGERLIWAQGDGSTLQAFDTSLGKIGGLICWENFMPLARQALYNWGTQILAAPTWDKSENWLLSLRHIAREGGLFIISCCAAIRTEDIPPKYEFKKLYPEGREWINVGNSCMINPKGEFIAGPVEKKEEIIYADIDLKLISVSKRMFDAAGHYARSDVFKLKLNREPNV
jgi:nitrilase